VFRAEDSALGRSVALKVLHRQGAKGQPGLTRAGAARILREARVAATLHHPNAVSVFDADEAGGVPYLVMELVQGRTLREVMSDARVTVERRVGWLIDVARALAAAHAKGIVHQDIKPENVMIRDDDVVKVLDFGIARLIVEEEDPTSGQASSTSIYGTPAYMAPERMRGEKGDTLADQFAWGVLAYELLTGRHPWDATGDIVHLARDMVTRAPEAPSRHDSEVPSAVDAVVLRALSLRTADRFGSMGDVAAALITAWSGGAHAAVTNEAERASRRPSRRRAARLVAARVAGVALAASLAVCPDNTPLR